MKLPVSWYPDVMPVLADTAFRSRACRELSFQVHWVPSYVFIVLVAQIPPSKFKNL